LPPPDLKRSLPEQPTMSETVPGYEVTQWYGILVPAGAPREIIDRLHQEIVRSVASPKVAQVLASIGTVPITNSPKEFRAFIQAESTKWAKVIKAANLRSE